MAISCMDDRPRLNEDIWEGSERLGFVKRWALSYFASPFAVLGALLVRLAGEDSWRHLLSDPGGTGETSACGMSAVVAAPPGTGKSVSRHAADAAVSVRGGRLPAPGWVSFSTPEGMAGIYLEKVTDPNRRLPGNGNVAAEPFPVWKQMRYQGIGFIDEIAEWAARVGRSVKWLSPTLSEAHKGIWREETGDDPRPVVAPKTHFSLYTGIQDHQWGKPGLGSGILSGWEDGQLLLDGVYPPAASHPETEGDIPRIAVNMPDCGDCAPCSGSDPFENIRPHIWGEPAAVRKQAADNGNPIRRRVAKHLAVFHNSPSTRMEDWEIAGELMEHDRRLRVYLEEKKPETAG